MPTWDVSHTFTFPSHATVNESSIMLPNTGPTTVNEATLFPPVTGYTIPPGVSSVTITLDAPTFVSVDSVQFYVHHFDSSGNPVGSYETVLRSVTDNTEFHTLTYSVPAGAVYWIAVCHSGDSNSQTFTVEIIFDYADSPGTIIGALAIGGLALLPQAGIMLGAFPIAGVTIQTVQKPGFAQVIG